MSTSRSTLGESAGGAAGDYRINGGQSHHERVPQLASPSTPDEGCDKGSFFAACDPIEIYMAMGQYPVLSRGPPPPLLQTLVAPALFQTLVARHCWGTSNITDRNVAE